MRLYLSLLLIISMVSSWMPVSAAGRGSVPVIGVMGLMFSDEYIDGSDELKTMIINRFRRSGKVEVVVPAGETYKKEEDTEGKKLLSEAKGFLREGEKAFFDSNFDKAYKYLSKARRGLIRTLYLLDDNKDLFKVHLLLGRTLMALGEKKKAKMMFKKAIFIAPDESVSSRDYPPTVRKMIAELKQKQMALKEVKVEIISRPPGAEVFVNGKRVGKTPLTIPLPEGEYFIRISKKRYKSWYSSISISEDNSKLERVLVPLSGASTSSENFDIAGDVPSLPQARIDYLSEAAFSIGSDYLLLGRAAGGELALQLFDLRTQELSPVARSRFGNSPIEKKKAVISAVDKLVEYINREGYLAVTTNTVNKTGTSKYSSPAVVQSGVQPQWKARGKQFKYSVKQHRPKEWYEKWWSWAIIFAVAGGAGYLAATQLSSGNDQIIVVNPR